MDEDRTDEVEIYQARDGQWRWRKDAPNGEIIAQGESHPDKSGAYKAARRANRDLPDGAFRITE